MNTGEDGKMKKKIENMTKRELMKEIDMLEARIGIQKTSIKSLENVLNERDTMILEISNHMGRENFMNMLSLLNLTKH